MTEQIKSPGLGPLQRKLSQEEIEVLSAQFLRAVEDGHELYRQQIKMMEENPELLDMRQGRVSLLVPLSQAGGEPTTPRSTDD